MSQSHHLWRFQFESRSGEVYSIQHYVIPVKFFSNFPQVGVIFPGTPVSYTNKPDRLAIFEITLKVALNTITITPSLVVS